MDIAEAARGVNNFFRLDDKYPIDSTEQRL